MEDQNGVESYFMDALLKGELKTTYCCGGQSFYNGHELTDALEGEGTWQSEGEQNALLFSQQLLKFNTYMYIFLVVCFFFPFCLAWLTGAFSGSFGFFQNLCLSSIID